jgi:hypothetical protein
MALVLLPGAVGAQTDGFDKEAVALLYHKISGEALDFQAAAGMSEAVRRASNFDRADVIKAEVERLKSQLATANLAQEFTIRVSDSISDYNHDRSEFSIVLFTPGHFVPVQAFGQEYQLAFANAEGAHAIPMPKEEAREFDARLNKTGRAVTDEIHFRVIGKGDPAGGVTGARVIRAEITSTQLVDRAGHVVFTPKVRPYQAAGGAGRVLNRAEYCSAHRLRVEKVQRLVESLANRHAERRRRKAAGQIYRSPSATLSS